MMGSVASLAIYIANDERACDLRLPPSCCLLDFVVICVLEVPWRLCVNQVSNLIKLVDVMRSGHDGCHISM